MSRRLTEEELVVLKLTADNMGELYDFSNLTKLMKSRNSGLSGFSNTVTLRTGAKVTYANQFSNKLTYKDTFLLGVSLIDMGISNSTFAVIKTRSEYLYMSVYAECVGITWNLLVSFCYTDKINFKSSVFEIESGEYKNLLDVYKLYKKIQHEKLIIIDFSHSNPTLVIEDEKLKLCYASPTRLL